ncbi:hypothetical protein [Larsenimonas salina]|uniref:hypothetical protein n=1 Tax=Larsenimonas salina TaxID=1295565 RepID=UPI00207328CE|nr:hypothetical protein [Larsenimonas salina]MCM5703513.1 hypothetical protein [Larsenimonas salina]
MDAHFEDDTPMTSPNCPQCGCTLEWPKLSSRTRDDQWLYCANGHPICTVKEFRFVAEELLLSAELAERQRRKPMHRAA